MRIMMILSLRFQAGWGRGRFEGKERGLTQEYIPEYRAPFIAKCLWRASGLLVQTRGKQWWAGHWSSQSPASLVRLQNHSTQGLPWWRSGWESTCQCRGHGFKSWSRKTPHAVEQLSLCATTTEPALYSLRATTTEPTCHNYWSLHA